MLPEGMFILLREVVTVQFGGSMEFVWTSGRR